METLLKQIRKINKRDIFGGRVIIEITEDDLLNLLLHLHVEDGIHRGANYTFSMQLYDTFLDSEKPPKLTCLSPIYHPNIITHGTLCCNLLGEEWQPGTTLEAIIATIYCLLNNPEFDNPLGGWRDEDISSSSSSDKDGNESDEDESETYYTDIETYESMVQARIQSSL